MKYLSKLPVKIAIAVAVGFIFASVGTKMTYDCAPVDGAMGCVSFEKAIMHPADLLNNRQNSLVKFSANFAVVALVTYIGSSAIVLVKEKRT